MSKRLEVKKEAAVRLNDFYSALEGKKRPEENPQEYRLKYNLLLKRFNEMEKVYTFHRNLIQNMSGSLVTIDEQGKITFMNRSALAAIGYNLDEVMDKPLLEFFADRSEGEKIVHRILKERFIYESKETHLITKNGEIFPIGFSTSYPGAIKNGDTTHVIFSFRNIKQVINLRRQIERMERLATLGELSTGIAHEIRNPLAGIKTSAQVLEESFSPADFRSQLVTRIVKEIDRSNELLKRFFNFAKPSRPKQGLHNIEMIIDGVYLLLAPRFGKKRINFRTDFASDTPQVYVDESQIEQVILNIFLNAIDAMPKGGDLIVTTQTLEKAKLEQESPEQKAVQVSIKDTGSGIPHEQLEKIFNPFFTTKSDGLGLGLSISNRLLAENGGKMEVESEVGQGTVIHLYLPIIDAQERYYG
ncbi:MAG TPA: PAS domain S-box protein [Caldithrix abyssi]|uniref:histidine kinase n=1 Tax=Caldithrix abyssi TaxID=187145 RepID=A0A7V4WW12_CALAY|nr:PAS domain S-box protein [Caldithrix abyssi]